MAIFFIITWFVLLFYAVRLISQGWSAASDLSKPIIEEKKRTVQRPMHPEMAEVKTGDELLVVNFNKQPEPQDPLYKSLQDRMDSGQVEDPWEDEEEDDDGDIVIGRK